MGLVSWLAWGEGDAVYQSARVLAPARLLTGYPALTPALSQRAREMRSALRATFTVKPPE